MKLGNIRLPGKWIGAVLLTAALCACSPFADAVMTKKTMVIQAEFLYSRAELAQMGEDACAYLTAINFRGSEWFAVLFPALAAFPSVSAFAGQWFGGYYYMAVSRQSKRAYAAHHLMRAAAAGFSIAAAGIFVYTALVYARFPVLRPGEDSQMLVYGATALRRAVTLACAAFHVGLLAALWSMLAVLCCAVFRSGFLSVSLMILIPYASDKLYRAFQYYLFEQYNTAEPPRLLRAVQFLFPTTHLYYDMNFTVIFGRSYLLFLLYAAAVSVGFLLWLLFLIGSRNLPCSRLCG